MLDRPLKGLRNVKKVLENSVTEFFVLELSRVRSPGIFCSGRKKSWNFLKKIFLEFREKMEFLEFSGPRIFLSWNVLSGNFLSRDFVSRKILAFEVFVNITFTACLHLTTLSVSASAYPTHW